VKYRCKINLNVNIENGYLCGMRKWVYRIFLAIASMIVLAHNITPHYHHNTPYANHDDDNDHDADYYHHHFGNHNIDHSFTDDPDFPTYKQINAWGIILPQLFQLTLSPAEEQEIRYHLPKDESPPPLQIIHTFSLRGPPAC
jgi:hypothetical protein